ncbi:MAG: SulP family inorganic anion transporter [Clostridia bacterium]|nr:SulP family inorganic anion transporter [Clostridia bacterium]
MISQFVKDLKKEFSGYDFKRFTKDLMAGITVAAVALPLAIAFGIGSVGPDNPPMVGAAAGMITAIIAGLIMSAFSGASFQISGPTGAMTAILMGLVAQHGLEGVFMVTFIAGIILIITALTKCGKLVTYIPTPVITGFTSGIAIIIALGQVDNFFGVKAIGDSAITKLISYFTTPGCFDANWLAAGVALFTILIMVLWPKKWGAKVPGSLIAIILATVVCSVFSIDVATIGEIPRKLIADDRLTFAAFDFAKMTQFITPAISIAALGMIESLLCGAAAGRMKGEKLNADRELLAQGIGNLVIPFFGGVPATAAIARTAVAIKSGCETRLTGIIHAVVLLLSMFLLAPLMARVPLSALAGVLMVTAWRMNEWENITYMFKKKMKTGIVMFLITMVSTVVFDLTIAIIIGVVGSIIFFVIKIANIDVTMADVDIKSLSENGIELNAEHGDTKMVYIAGPIFFATIEKLSATMEEIQEKTIVILSMRAVTLIDTSGAVALLELCEKFKEEGRCVLFCGVQPKVKKTLEVAGVVDLVGEETFFWDATAAIKHADKLLLNK